jgi:hypothetical protein
VHSIELARCACTLEVEIVKERTRSLVVDLLRSNRRVMGKRQRYFTQCIHACAFYLFHKPKFKLLVVPQRSAISTPCRGMALSSRESVPTVIYDLIGTLFALADCLGESGLSAS